MDGTKPGTTKTTMEKTPVTCRTKFMRLLFRHMGVSGFIGTGEAKQTFSGNMARVG